MIAIPLTARDVTVTYSRGWRKPDKIGIKHVDLTLAPGQIWGLAGLNGAGKSSLLRALIGLLLPQSGEVQMFGAAPTATGSALRLGYLPERFAAFGHLTVRENLHLYGELSHMAPNALAAAIDRMLARMELTANQHERVAVLSKGTSQRLGLAQSLLHSPDLIVWDEPASGLDPLGRRLVKELIDEVKSAGKTLLMASHILADIEGHCDHVAIVAQGTLRLQGHLPSLLAQYHATNLEDLFMQTTQEQRP